jgi:hypothetical protein
MKTVTRLNQVLAGGSGPSLRSAATTIALAPTATPPNAPNAPSGVTLVEILKAYFVVPEAIGMVREARNPHAEATTGVDLQVPAILAYLERHGLALQGTEVVDIGSWEGRASHPLSIRPSPLAIAAAGDPKRTLEQFWQQKKCLAIWDEES